MSHSISFNALTGEHAFFSVHHKPWHGLGKIVEKFPTSSEAIIYAGLDYEVSKRPLFTIPPAENNLSIEPTNGIAIDNYYATVRNDTQTVLGVVGKDYQIVQNRDAFSFFDSIVGGDGILYETAGALGKGERIFITAKLPGYIKVGKQDLIEQYLFLTTSHDGSGSITAAFTPVRIVCANTLNAALKNHSNAIRVKHTANAKDRLQQAHKIMGITKSLSEALGHTFNHWSKTRITDKGLEQLIEQCMSPGKETISHLSENSRQSLSAILKNTCGQIYDYAMTAESQQMESTKGTLFGAYNAITGYYQNIRKWNNEEAKLKSILLGGTAQIRAQKAFNLCAALAIN